MFDERRLPATAALVLYCVVTFLLIAAYRFMSPGSAEPLPPFAFLWRFTAAVADFVSLYPAIALSAIVASFGFGGYDGGGSEARFSPRFLESMTKPLITVIVAAALYALLFLLALPTSLDARTSMAAEGQLFRAAKALAESETEAERWREAARSMATCERIWPNSEETEAIRDKLRIGLEQLMREEGETAEAARPAAVTGQDNAFGPSLPGTRRPLNATEALALASRALRDGHPFDAHWYATLARKLAKEGSPEAASAATLAASAWNSVSSMESDGADKAAFAVFKRKREGYQAIEASDWIRAYYIFSELSRKVPRDPDVVNFLALSKQGAEGVAFFADEVAAAIGSVETGALYSIPRRDGEGRDVVYARSLNRFEDATYAEGLEVVSFTGDGTMRYALEAKYAKFIPFTVEESDADDAEARPVPRTVLLLLALDRQDQRVSWAPSWRGKGRPDAVATRLILDASFEDLALASRARRGVDVMPLNDLDDSAKRLGAFGFVPEAFRAELLRRYSEPFAFLTLAIVALALGWRFRSPRGAGTLGLAMLVALPFVFNLPVQFFRLVASTTSTAFVLALPFGAAIAAALAFQGLVLILALVYLAGQRG